MEQEQRSRTTQEMKRFHRAVFLKLLNISRFPLNYDSVQMEPNEPGGFLLYTVRVTDLYGSM